MSKPYFNLQHITPVALLEETTEDNPVSPAIRYFGEASQTIAQFDIVYIASYSGGIAQFAKASSAATSTAPGLLFVALNDAASGGKVVVTLGPISVPANTFGGTIGEPWYLSTGGGTSSSAGAVARKVGEISEVSATGSFNFCGWMAALGGTSTTLDYLAISRAMTGAGEAFKVTATISHATQSAEGADVSISQVTNARTSGDVIAYKGTVTSLNGTTAGVDHVVFDANATAGDADSDHIGLRLGSAIDVTLDSRAQTTGKNAWQVGSNLADALSIKSGTTSWLTLKTTTATPNWASSLALTGAGNAWDLDSTINHATGAHIGLDVSAAQITTARTAGTVTGIKSTVTSLTGTTAGVDHYAYEAAVTVGEANADHYAFKVGAGFDAVMDLTSCATGEANFWFASGLASCVKFGEVSVDYLKFVSTVGGQSATFGVPMRQSVTTVDMADGTWSLVLGAAGASETKLTGNIVFCDPNSTGAGEDLRLPPVAGSAGLPIDIINTGGENIVVKDSTGGTTYVTIATGKSARVVCNGTTWGVIAGA